MPGPAWLRYVVPCTLVLLSFPTLAQRETLEDTTHVLEEVTVQAYEAGRDPRELAASVDPVLKVDLGRMGNASLLPAFNMIPGVRMEERSPGSYRFSIRGSLLRSPFGIRNVKFYWKGLPLTDAGGNTYLNLIDPIALGRAEVIKGPASSLYGAGTGGAVLLEGHTNTDSGVHIGVQGGSYGALRYHAALDRDFGNSRLHVLYSNQRAEGYREQSEMKRNFLNLDYSLAWGKKDRLSLSFFSSNLRYETPGGLTLAQFGTDPRQARPATPTLPGAVEQEAHVANHTWFGGLTWLHLWNEDWSSRLSILAARSDFRNAAILNYETRNEANAGIRWTNEYDPAANDWLNIVTGLEYQVVGSTIQLRNNDGGTQGSAEISTDHVQAYSFTGFLQAEISLSPRLSLTTGASINLVEYHDDRTSFPPITASRKFSPVISPRFALLHKFSERASAFISVSRGFSPPTIAEIIPSTGIYNPTLNPESGWSYEAGFMARPHPNLSVELSVYDFRLTQAIVLQRDSSGADYFINAGNTQQPGVEFNVQWGKQIRGFVKSLRTRFSATYTHYRFGDYVNDGNDYSGNLLTGVSPFIGVAGIDLNFQKGLFLQVTGQWVDRIPLNDANTDYAIDYFLLGGRAGYRSPSGKLEFYFGVDNALDQRYSLGNDLNAAGKRYYNAAPRINYFAGISFRYP